MLHKQTSVDYKYNKCLTRYKIQEALFNAGLHDNLITLAHLSYFPTNKCKATRHKKHTEYLK